MRRRLAMNVFRESLGTKEPCYATGFVSPKTTALFFDKIWLTDEEAERNKVPLSLRLIFDDEDEIIITNAYKDATCNNICYNIAAANNALEIIDIEKPGENQHSLKTNHFSSEIKGVRMGSDILEGRDVLRQIDEKMARFLYTIRTEVGPDKYGFFTSFNRNEALRVITNRCRRKGINLIPVFIEQTDFEKSLLMLGLSNNMKPEDAQLKKMMKEMIPVREVDTIAATIKAIPVVVEDGLSWEQVREIRKDKKSVEDLRRFRAWALQELAGKSQSEITDILGKELDDYEYALSKHGVLTTVGSFTTILSSASTIIEAIEGSQLQLAAAGFMISAGVITFTAQQIYEYFDARRHPIAYNYNITER